MANKEKNRPDPDTGDVTGPTLALTLWLLQKLWAGDTALSDTLVTAQPAYDGEFSLAQEDVEPETFKHGRLLKVLLPFSSLWLYANCLAFFPAYAKLSESKSWLIWSSG